LKLALDGFYDGTRFHRLINDFMIQGGDPLSRDETRKSEWGHGGPGYTFADEIDLNRKMTAGTVAFANSGPNTNGSQFFILTKDADWLNGQHTVLGKVVRGMEVAETISKISAGVTGVPNQDIILRRITFK
jgi:peptidylprolyl isomerase